MAITDEKYVAFTTYKKDGTPTSVPVWIVDLGEGMAGFNTPDSSWKFKRLANNSAVQLQPSDSRGNVKAGSSVIEATAEATTDPVEFAAVRAKVKAKYGFAFHLVQVMLVFQKLFRVHSGSNASVIITLPEA